MGGAAAGVGAGGPVRIGVVGAGALGYHHVRILRDVEGAALAGFVEERPERARPAPR